MAIAIVAIFLPIEELFRAPGAACDVKHLTLLGGADPVQRVHLATNKCKVLFALLLARRQLRSQVNGLLQQPIILGAQLVAAHANVLIVCDLGCWNVEPGRKSTAAAAQHPQGRQDGTPQCSRHLTGSGSLRDLSPDAYAKLTSERCCLLLAVAQLRAVIVLTRRAAV
jgi:hypothetical protein